MDDKLIEPKELARLFGYENVRSIEHLTQDGIIDATLVTVNGKKVRRYDLIPTVSKYVKHLRNKANGRASISSEAVDDEQRRIKAEADLKEYKAKIEGLKAAEFEGIMHRSEDVEQITIGLVTAVRSELLALPGMLAVDMAATKSAAEAAGIIKASVNNILNNLTDYGYDPAAYKKRVREREKWMNEEENGKEESETAGY